MKQQKEREWQLSIRERELKRQKEEMKAEQQARLKAAGLPCQVLSNLAVDGG